MMDIIKAWPSYFPREKVYDVFSHDFGCFYFSVGKGKPSQPVANLWYTHSGDILGHFKIRELIFNENERTLPRLRSISNQESQWQFRPGIWVAICPGPFVKLEESLRYAGFRGWRYFDIDEHRGSIDALVVI
jgi:hypothetical protein